MALPLQSKEICWIWMEFASSHPQYSDFLSKVYLVKCFIVVFMLTKPGWVYLKEKVTWKRKNKLKEARTKKKYKNNSLKEKDVLQNYQEKRKSFRSGRIRKRKYRERRPLGFISKRKSLECSKNHLKKTWKKTTFTSRVFLICPGNFNNCVHCYIHLIFLAAPFSK